MDESVEDTVSVRAKGGGRRWFGLLAVALVLAGAAWVYTSLSTADRELSRAQDALKLQVLTSRLGVAAVEADYGNFDRAAEVVSGVFDGIQNYGIEHGSLPENFAEVLERRDEMTTGLVRSNPNVAAELTALFYRLQIPVDTELDPRFIIPAADSGIGLEPPHRSTPDTADSPDSATVSISVTPPPYKRGGQAVPEVAADSMLP